MDLATRLRQWQEHPPEHWAQAVNRRLAQVASAGLVLALGYALAQLTWALIPGNPATVPAPVITPAASEAPTARVGGGVDDGDSDTTSDSDTNSDSDSNSDSASDDVTVSIAPPI